MAFSEELRSLREQRNLTQKDIAEYLGVTRQAVASYELGKREPDYDILKRLADYFSVSIDHLLGRIRHNSAHVLKKEQHMGINIDRLLFLQCMDSELVKWISDEGHMEYVKLAKEICDSGLSPEVFKPLINSIKAGQDK